MSTVDRYWLYVDGRRTREWVLAADDGDAMMSAIPIILRNAYDHQGGWAHGQITLVHAGRVVATMPAKDVAS